MSLQPSLEDNQLEKKLKNLYGSLDAVLKDDAYHTKIQYRENEVRLGVNVTSVNEHIMFNRLKKVKLLTELAEHWDDFKNKYQNDPILNRIGVEFLEDKFYFDKYVLNTIKEYPNRNQVLYFFPKGVPLNVPELEMCSYLKIKEKILPTIEQQATVHLEQKKKLLECVNQISANKSTQHLSYLSSISDGKNNSSKIDLEWMDIIPTMRKDVIQGNFKATEIGNKMMIELPLPGSRLENGTETKHSTSVLTVDLNNPLDYTLEVGSLPKNELKFLEKLHAIREKCLTPSVACLKPFKALGEA